MTSMSLTYFNTQCIKRLEQVITKENQNGRTVNPDEVVKELQEILRNILKLKSSKEKSIRNVSQVYEKILDKLNATNARAFSQTTGLSLQSKLGFTDYTKLIDLLVDFVSYEKLYEGGKDAYEHYQTFESKWEKLKSKIPRFDDEKIEWDEDEYDNEQYDLEKHIKFIYDPWEEYPVKNIRSPIGVLYQICTGKPGVFYFLIKLAFYVDHDIQVMIRNLNRYKYKDVLRAAYCWAFQLYAKHLVKKANSIDTDELYYILKLIEQLNYSLDWGKYVQFDLKECVFHYLEHIVLTNKTRFRLDEINAIVSLFVENIQRKENRQIENIEVDRKILQLVKEQLKLLMQANSGVNKHDREMLGKTTKLLNGVNVNSNSNGNSSRQSNTKSS